MLEHNAKCYIRPIAVVRVERTGKNQRDGERVHAEDVREYLMKNLSVPADAIRVKSAENDELGRENLPSEFLPVRWIITKSALMEGWDCPFAYLLVMLDNTQAPVLSLPPIPARFDSPMSGSEKRLVVPRSPKAAMVLPWPPLLVSSQAE